MKKILSNLLFVILALSFQNFICAQSESSKAGWENLDEILKNIVPPSFPDKEFNIVNYGAKGDGETDCTEAFAKAIEECTGSGGGKVIVPEGTFLTGPIHLKSNVNLFVSEKAVVKFSTDFKKYLPVVFSRWEGVECMNYSPLIYAYEAKNIAVTGKGVLDGQAGFDNWWGWNNKKESPTKQTAGRNKLFEMAVNNIPPEERIMGEGHYLRPPFIQPYKCKNILIEGVTFKDSPFWFIHPVLSQNISVIGVTVKGMGPNNDGCDPESSKDVLIKDCYFDTGDDCIAIKSGRNTDGRRINIPSENIVIQNCEMKDGHGGVVIGSEISGSVRNVYAEDCRMDSPNLDRALRIKTNAVRGGVVENIYMRNVKVGEVGEAVVKINYYYEEGDEGEFIPKVQNVHVENVTSEKSRYGIWIRAYENSPAENITLKNCAFSNVAEGNVLENVKEFHTESVTINGEEIED
ncbi:MAG: glycoside hydrolase family 28 protein [Ignavibacteriaceae bacterium]